MCVNNKPTIMPFQMTHPQTSVKGEKSEWAQKFFAEFAKVQEQEGSMHHKKLTSTSQTHDQFHALPPSMQENQLRDLQMGSNTDQPQRQINLPELELSIETSNRPGGDKEHQTEDLEEEIKLSDPDHSYFDNLKGSSSDSGDTSTETESNLELLIKCQECGSTFTVSEAAKEKCPKNKPNCKVVSSE